MKSPFPGMDPYLEAHWGDIHTSLMVYARNQLNEQLPGDLRAAVEETEVEPTPATMKDEPQTLRDIEIVETSNGGSVITAIEFLSPVNKVSSREQVRYVLKQRDFLDAGVNLMEIDLIRAGNHVLAVPEGRLPAKLRTPYMVCVSRATKRNQTEVYPVPLQQPLPNIPVPLRPKDEDAVLRLQELIDDCYRDGRYATRLDYRLDPVPRLGESDARWIDAILREKGLR